MTAIRKHCADSISVERINIIDDIINKSTRSKMDPEYHFLLRNRVHFFIIQIN